MRKEIKKKLHQTFINEGKLADFRGAIALIKAHIRKDIAICNAHNQRGQAQAYLSQLKFDFFIDSSLLLSWMKADRTNINYLKLPLPASWIKVLNSKTHLPNRPFVQNREMFLLRMLVLSLRRLGRIFLLIRNSGEQPWQIDLLEKNQMFVIGHVKEVISSDEHVEGAWDYQSWIRTNTQTDAKVHFLPEIVFMELVLKKMSDTLHLNRIILTLRLMKRSLVRSFELFDSFYDRILCLDQIFLSELVALVGQQFDSCVQIQFTESIGSKRPYWTYEAEKQGWEIELRFFANYATLGTRNKFEVPPQFDFYSWSRIIVVSDWQYDLIPKRNLLGETVELTRSGLPWFQDDLSFDENKCVNALVVFDYEPGENHYGYSTLNDLGLASYPAQTCFRKTILSVCKENGIKMLLKPKRWDMVKNGKLFQSMLASEGSRTRLELVPGGVSPHRIISRALGVVSLPPTSTGLIAKQMLRPTIYFDPIGKVMKGDVALQGVPILSTTEELRLWVSSLTNVV